MQEVIRDLIETCERCRKDSQVIVVEADVMLGKTKHCGFVHPESIANVVLAKRHLEDARMRLGKAIQYLGDGVSIYDKNEEKSSG